MKKISDEQMRSRDELFGKVEEAKQNLDQKIEEFNEEVKRLFSIGPSDALDELNSALADVRQWAEDMHSETESYFDHHSEEWQESKEGQAYSEWSSDFDEASSRIDDVELEEPEPLYLSDEVDISYVEDLEESPQDTE
jgi:vacuolar-type H+-ATPase subunit H